MLTPHSQELKDVISAAKNGQDTKSQYQQFVRLYESGNMAESLYPDFGWLIYYTLKSTSPDDTIQRKELLYNYLKLGLTTPCLLHSLILSEAVKVEHNTPMQFRIREFADHWGLENLREEDWQQYHTEAGNTLPSLVEKLIGAYVKELRTNHIQPSEGFSHLVDRALQVYPTSQNMPYFKATMLIAEGKREEAISYYRTLILRFPSKFYLWYQTAVLIDDIDTQIGLLGKALTLGDDEQFLGGVRLTMAKLLSKKGDLSHAKYELEKYRRLYESKGWKIKSEFSKLYNQLLDINASNDNRSIYNEYAVKADEFIYSQLPEQAAVKISEKMIDDRHRDGHTVPIWILKTRSGVLRLKKPAKFGLDRRLRIGTVFSIRVHDDKIVWIKALDTIPTTDWIKETKGEVRVHAGNYSKRYGFVDGVYVGDKLLESVSDGQQVRCLAIKQDDGRWSAVSLQK